MPELSDIQRDLDILAGELRRLEIEYNLFFMGRLPRPPWETRRRVETILKGWDNTYIRVSLDRFRFSTLQARYSTFSDLWDREMRAREMGRSGPLSSQKPPKVPAASPPDKVGRKATTFLLADPVKEMDQLESLYETV